jgi:hypothetical protein
MILTFRETETKVEVEKIKCPEFKKHVKYDFTQISKSERIYKLVCDYLNIEEKMDVTLLNCDMSKVTSLFIVYFESLPDSAIIDSANLLVKKFVETEILYNDFADQISLALAFIMCYNRSEEFCKVIGTDMVVIKDTHANAVRKLNDEKEVQKSRENMIAQSIAATKK